MTATPTVTPAATNGNQTLTLSGSNIYTGGLFVADHVFEANARSRQCGAAVLLKRLQAA